MTNFELDVQRVLQAREIVCPSIILTFHRGDEFSFGCLVIDYIGEQYEKRSEVVRDYITYGNTKDSVKGYGNLIDSDIKMDKLKVKYYYDVTSYLFDPEKCRPVISTPSTYKNIDPRMNVNLTNVLNYFVEYLEELEKEYEKMEEEEEGNGFFIKEVFTKPNEVAEILNRNEHLESFNELIKDSDYFNYKLF